MRYMVSVVLLKNAMIESDDYHDSSPWATDPRVAALTGKVTIVEDPQFTHDYHNRGSATSGLTISLTDGSKLDEVVVEFPIGHPKHSDTLAKVEDKFRRNMGSAFTEKEIDRIIEAVGEDDMSVHKFVDLLLLRFSAK
jgi:2-methylcitrate dehydratase